MFLKTYGQVISKLRKKHGLTQKQLGKKLNVSYQAVSKWENNLSEPDLETLEKLADIFGISVSEFFDMSKNTEQTKNDTVSMTNNNNADNNITNKINNTSKTTNFIKTKPWYIVAGLGVLIVILLLCAFLIPVKYSSKQVFNRYDCAIFYVSAENSSSTKIGTGFFINNKGLAVTAYSNIENCTKGTVKLNNGQKYNISKIVGVDEKNNVAIIQIDIKKSSPVEFGDSNKVEMGDKVYSITYSEKDKMDNANSIVSEGMIYKTESNNDGTTSIQTTASISNATKGGVLFNQNGKVIGIISDELTVSGVGLDIVNVCVPINVVKKVKQNINVSLEEYVNNLCTLTFINPDNQIIETKDVKKGFVLNEYNKTGYVISGLYKDKEFKNPYDLKSFVMSSQNIYVDLRPIQYTIVFNANGADGTMESQTLRYDEVQTLKKCNFYIENKMFCYWIYNGYIHYNDEEQIKNLTSEDNEVLIFDAVWDDLTFTINFDANGGNGYMDSVSYRYDTTYTIPRNNFSKTGYKFSHWECEGVRYQNEQTLGKLSDTQTNFVFKAIWTPITYTVRYSASNYSYNLGTFSYDEDFVLTNCVYRNQEVDYFTYNGKVYHVGDSVKNLATYNKTVTLEIIWKGVDFKINYYLDETTYETYAYTWGNVVLAHYSWFKKDGYTYSSFKSLKFDKTFVTSFTLSDYKYEIQPNEVLDFIVEWKPNPYKVVVDNFTISDETIYCIYDQEYVVPENKDNKQGHTFTNYTLRINGEDVKTMEVGEKFSNLTSKYNDTVYLIPNWQINQITINYYVDGEVWKTDITEYNSYYVIPNYTQEKMNMWFNGWMYNNEYFDPGTYSQVKFLDCEINMNAIWSQALKGEGTDANPYLIETYDDLCSLTYLFGNENFTHKTYKLVNDIDCENKEVPAINNFYYNIFDGNNKVIKNAKFEKSLFDFACDSTIKNLGVENFTINYTGYDQKNFAGFIVACSGTTIENCWTVGKITVHCYQNEDYESINVGGFCAWANSNPTIRNCYSKTEITFSRSNPNDISSLYVEVNIGGFIASYSGIVENCYSIASFNSRSYAKPFICNLKDSTITNCFYGSSVTSTSFLDNPDLIQELDYKIQKDNTTIQTENIENLYNLNYLNTTLGFDILVWNNKETTFPTLKSFEVTNENNNK